MSHNRSSRRLRLLPVALLSILVAVGAGCAQVEHVPAGTPAADLTARYGEPTAVHALPDGSQNVEYTLQPMGQQTWMVHVVDGRVASVNQVLTQQEFAKVDIGHDDQNTISAHFGTPAEVTPLPRMQRLAWSYRMQVDGSFPALMVVQFDPDGIVREVFSTFDPLRDGHHGNGLF
jgi:hypothetical protein